MAIYHLSVKPVSRSAGRSATASAAYRAGERGKKILDERTGQIHDYTRKGGVESADLVLPEGAPEWARDRAALWNAAELVEKRKDACVAREYEVALPAELAPEERRRLAMDFAQEMANRERCAVDVAIHAPGRGGDERNHHAHLLRTTRKVEAAGLGEKLDSEKAGRNRKADLEAIRERWAELVNERLREHGLLARIDHRSLEAQGIARGPTQHKGPAVTGIERRGKSSEVGRRMAEANRSLLDLSGDLTKAKAERDRRPSAEEVEKGKAEARQAYERFKDERAAQARAIESQRLKAEQEAERERQLERQRIRSRDREQDRGR